VAASLQRGWYQPDAAAAPHPSQTLLFNATTPLHNAAAAHQLNAKANKTVAISLADQYLS
jgi:hypothetical protein